MLRLMVEALPEATVHRNEFLAFDAKLRRERPNDVQQWEEMVLAWEHDRRGCPSPFTIQTRGTSPSPHASRLPLTTVLRCHSHGGASAPPR